MDSTVKQKNKRAGGLLLLILYGAGLSCLFLSGPARAEVKEEWVSTFSSSKWSYNYPKAIHVDKKGNVYVTGYPSTIKYSPGGRELWNHQVSSRASCLDSYGNIYLTGIVTVNGDHASGVSKYDADGNLLWKAHYQGPQQFWEEPIAIAVDRRGNVYVTGASGVRTNLADIATVKYSPDGVLLWAARYHGRGQGTYEPNLDYPQAIAVDRQGNVYVTGSCHEVNLNKIDYATIKYSTDGEELWVRHYNGTGKGQDCPNALAVDNQGNVYVTGESWGSGTNSDYATIKYNSDGKELWVRRYNSGKGRWDSSREIAVDRLGNVYVTGVCATIKYNPCGKKLWERRVQIPGEGVFGATAMTLDNQDNIYVTGMSNGNYTTIKYSPEGNELWFMKLNGPTGGQDEPTAIAVDDYYNVYVTGCVDCNWTSYIMDYGTVKYRQHGRIPADSY